MATFLFQVWVESLFWSCWSECAAPTRRCVDLADISQHLSHSHLLLPLRIEFPVHHRRRFTHRQLKLALRRQLAHVCLVLWSDPFVENRMITWSRSTERYESMHRPSEAIWCEPFFWIQQRCSNLAAPFLPCLAALISQLTARWLFCSGSFSSARIK